MSAKRIEKPDQAQAVEPVENPLPWSPKKRVIVSALIAFHVFAVFIAPMAAPPPASDVSRACAGAIEPYLKALAIDNGYRFFAPNPGPSHLIRYEVDLNDGTTVGGRFPDRDKHWPRLLYHRHFMLAETLFNTAVPLRELPPGAFGSALEREEFDKERERAQVFLVSIAKYLLRTNPTAERVKLFAQEHRIPSVMQMNEGMKLADAGLYDKGVIGVFTPDEIEQARDAQ